MWPIYPLSLEQEIILAKYLDKIIKDRKIQLFSPSEGSPISFIPQPNGKEL